MKPKFKIEYDYNAIFCHYDVYIKKWIFWYRIASKGSLELAVQAINEHKEILAKIDKFNQEQ